ncbi:hypothetical protein WJ968_20185 [Achromobacter xylosoxidans]
MACCNGASGAAFSPNTPGQPLRRPGAQRQRQPGLAQSHGHHQAASRNALGQRARRAVDGMPRLRLAQRLGQRQCRAPASAGQHRPAGTRDDIALGVAAQSRSQRAGRDIGMRHPYAALVGAI